MKKIICFLIFTMSICLNAQQTYYPVTAGIGYGIRFWNSDTYKIHMGNTSEYQFGPVTDYSIKMNMSNDATRGWTWGVVGTTPIAALNTLGDFQVKRNLFALGNVGIGTANPAEKLEVIGNIKTDKLIINESLPDGQTFSDYTDRNAKCNTISVGKLLNTATGARSFNFLDFPVSNLDSQSGFWFGIEDRSYHQRFTFTASTGGLSWFRLADKNQSEYLKVLEYDNGTGNISNVLQMGKPNSRIVIGQYATYLPEHKFVVKDGSALIEGNIITNSAIGIGIESSEIPADYKLAVAGNIISEEVKVKLKSSGWPDFVFNTNYSLPTLQDVENHIKEHGHLQGIPSAEEVAENGVLLGDMNAKLLQKIEELTLYTIEQQKLIEAQSKALKTQAETNQELKDRLAILEKAFNEQQNK